MGATTTLGSWRPLPPRQATGKPTLHYCYVTRIVGQGRPERHACERGYHLSRRLKTLDACGHHRWTNGSAAAVKCAERSARRMNREQSQ